MGTVKGEKVKHLTTKNSGFLTSDCVSALYEDYEGSCWVGTRGGIGVRLADGTDYRFETMNFNDSLSAGWIYVRDIIKDMDNSVWLATSNLGVIHITGDVRQPSTLKYENYSFHNRKLITNTVLCIHLDRFGRLWAGTGTEQEEFSIRCRSALDGLDKGHTYGYNLQRRPI